MIPMTMIGKIRRMFHRQNKSGERAKAGEAHHHGGLCFRWRRRFRLR